MKTAMKTRVRPFCPDHHLQMQSGAHVLASIVGEQNSLSVYCCLDGCPKVYDPARGYFDWVPGLMICEMMGANAAKRIPCQDCGRCMFISDIDTSQRVRIWRCANDTCSCTKTESLSE